MKNYFNLNQLSMNWKEKRKTGDNSMKPADDQQMTSRRPAEKPVRFFRYVAMLLMLLTLGVGQMWGYEFNYPYIYFNNSNSDGSQKWTRVMILFGNDGGSKGLALSQISNTNLWFVKGDNWGTTLGSLGYGFSDLGAWDQDGTGIDSRWTSLTSQTSNYTKKVKNDASYNLNYNTYYFTSSGTSNLTISKKADNGNWCEGTLPEYSAYLKVRKSENGGSSYNAAMTSGTWPGSLTLQGTKIKRNGDQHSGSTPYGSRTGDEAASPTTSGSQAAYTGNIITGLITMTLNSVTDNAYEFAGWGKGDSPTSTGNTKEYHITGNTTYYAFFKRKQFTVTFEPKGTYGTSTVTAAISTTPLTSGNSYNYASDITFTATPAAGYKLNPSQAWYSDAACESSLGNGTNTTYSVASLTAATSVYVKFVAKQSAITLDKQTSAEGYGSAGTATVSSSATYGAAMPALTGTLPTAANGYAFVGFYDEMGGEGTKYYNADGTSAHDWDKDTESGTTLYAYYKKAEIAELALSATAVPNDGSSITATPTISPTPTGTYHIEWELQYNNGTALPSQPTFTPGVGDAVSFAAPTTSATYRVHATLRLGTVVGSGTILDTRYTTFQVAGEHTVTIKYQDADGRTLRDTTHVLGKQLEWSSDITAPTIVGYKFDHWDAGDGVSIKNGASTVTTSTANPINIKASYAGTLTAVYAKKRVIYFNNTLNWDTVYVYFYKDATYWNDTYGTGTNNDSYSGSYIQKYGGMTKIAGTNIYYFDAEAADVNSSYQTVAFSKDKQTGYNWFSKTKVIRRTDYKSTTLPMYVPLADQDPTTYNSNTEYYKKGYWMNYPENTGYTLTIFDKVSGTPAPVTLKSIPFEFTGDYTMPMELNVDLEAGQTYGFKIYRNDGTWYGNDGKMTANTTNWAMETDKNNCGLQTTVAGNYKFSLAYFAVNGTYHYRVGVTFPVAVNDYRIVYTDGATWSKGAHSASWYHPSRVITKNSSATEVKRDTISFFWSYGSTPAIKSQQCTGLSAGNATWNAGTSINVSGYSSVLTKAGVYNFIFEQPKSGGSISLVGVEPYTGSYYIRTDCAGSTKWSNYQSHDHQMTYSDYAAAKSAAASNTGFTHYYAHWVTKNSNVKFVIANDYSPCISDTLVEDYSTVVATIIAEGNADAGKMTSDNASIRFMWNEITNKISRAYISGSTTVSDRFLVLEGDAKMFNKNGQALTTAGGGKVSGLNDNEMNFVDDQNFVYEQTIQVKTTACARLSAKYNGNVQYFIGSSGAWAAGTTVELLGGSASETKHNMRVVYDFKTNRLVTAYIPSGTIEENLPIHADLMIVREHQEAGQQLTFNGGKLTEVETVYGVMRFNRWTLNNKSTAAGHAVLGDPKSSYERGLYWISFPFDVNLGDVFGFGTYGVDWIMMEYDGAERAQKGYWKDSDGFWKYITSRVGKTLEAGKGYVLALDLARMKDDNPEFWTNNIEQVELFFPSAANVGGIEATTAHTTVDEHECTIDRRTDKSVNNINKDRTKADSHWNIIGVPSYANYGTTLYSNEGLSEAISWHSSPYTNDLPFLYEWNTVDNTYTVQSGATYPFKSLHAYMVQYHGDLYWKLASATPASIVARRTYAERPQSTEFRLELQQNEKMVDQTFVKLSNDEEVSANFVFDEDLCKEYNGNKANIYTFIEGYIPAAGNTLPISEQTTVVPVGVKTVASGDYTFAMPAGTDGVGVTLIDNETGLRTPLGLTDYTVSLEAGTYDERFALEISPVKQTPTGVELLNGENGENGVRKVMIDGILYIVKDGEVFDARGNRVK